MKHKELIIAGVVVVLIGLGTLYNYLTRETFFVGNKASFGIVDNSIYYQDGIDTEDVEKVGKALVDFKLFNDTDRFVIKLEKNEKEYTVYLPMLVENWKTKEFIESMQRLDERFESLLNYRFRTVLVDGDDTDHRLEIQR